MAESGSPDDGSDRRAWIKMGLWILAAAALLLLVGATMRFEERATFQCPHCLSTEEAEYVGFRFPGLGVFGGTPHAVTKPSIAFQEVFGGVCSHVWGVAAHSMTGRSPDKPVLFGTEGMNPLSVGYETSPAFRTLVRGKLADGRLTRTHAKELFSLPDRQDAKKLTDPGVRPLLDEANALLSEGGLPPHPAWAPKPLR
jgi:hypothetical protein